MVLASRAGTFAFGNGIVANRFAFGTSSLAAGTFAWGRHTDETPIIELLRHVREAGVNFVDTAEVYGPLIAEELIGQYLVPGNPELQIATKVGLYRNTDGSKAFKTDGSSYYIKKAIDGSLFRLKRDYVDLYQLHRVDPLVPIERSVEAMADLQRVGKVRNIGLSEVGIAEIERARSVAEIASVQNIYNIIDREYDDVLTYCEQHGIAFIPWSPIAYGQLARVGGAVDAIARAHGATGAQIALAWLLKRSPNIILIPGCDRASYFNENSAASTITLSDAEFEALSALNHDPALQSLRQAHIRMDAD